MTIVGHFLVGTVIQQLPKLVPQYYETIEYVTENRNNWDVYEAIKNTNYIDRKFFLNV